MPTDQQLRSPRASYAAHVSRPVAANQPRSATTAVAVACARRRALHKRELQPHRDTFTPVLGLFISRLPVPFEALDEATAAALRARVNPDVITSELGVHGSAGSKLLSLYERAMSIIKRQRADCAAEDSTAKQALREVACSLLAHIVSVAAPATLASVLVDLEKIFRKPRPATWRVMRRPSLASGSANDVTLIYLACTVCKTQVPRTLETVRILLEHGANPAEALMVAVASDDHDCVKLLVHHGASLKAKEPECGATVLHIAAVEGNVEMCRTLLSLGASVVATRTDGSTPLAAACIAADNKPGIFSVIQLLLNAKSPVNVANATGHTPLHSAVQKGSTRVVKLLLLQRKLRVNAETNGGARPVDIALQLAHPEILDVLLSHNASFESPDCACGLLLSLTENAMPLATVIDIARTLAHHGALRGALPIRWSQLVDFALENDRTVALLSALLDAGCPLEREGELDGPLFAAIAARRHDAVALLLDRGSSSNAPGVKGFCPLCAAVLADDTRLIRLLVEHGASLTARSREHGVTPLCFAALQKHATSCRELLAAGAEVDGESGNGGTPLAWACSFHTDESLPDEVADVVKALLAAGADPNAIHNKGLRCIHFAARAGCAPLVRLLLQHGAHVNTPIAVEREPPLHALDLAVHHGDRKCIAALLDAGATFAASCVRTTFMLDVVRQGDAAVAEAQLLIERGALRDSNETYLCELASFTLAGNSVAMMELLLDAGCPVDPPVGTLSPLVVAAGRGCLALVKLLLSRGANVRQKVRGMTPLKAALTRDTHVDVVGRVPLGSTDDYSAIVSLLRAGGATK